MAHTRLLRASRHTLPSREGHAAEEALLGADDRRAVAYRLAEDESRGVRFVSTVAFEGLQSNCHAVFRDLIACVTRPTEHFGAHVGEDHAPSSGLREFRS